jgi:hypothetical protein
MKTVGFLDVLHKVFQEKHNLQKHWNDKALI